LVCSGCSYSANIEKAIGQIPAQDSLANPLVQVPVFKHPEIAKVVSEIQELVAVNCKVEFGIDSEGIYVFVIPQERSINETKLIKNCNIQCRLENTFSEEAKNIRVIVDRQIATKKECPFPQYDIINTEKGDLCSSCNSELREFRAIEVAHTFYLGTKYSTALGATVKNAQQEAVPFEMGCYGIGVSRLLAATIESNYDKDGMVWPKSIAPYKVCIIHIPKDSNGSLMSSFLETLSEYVPTLFLEKDVILDDRDVSFGYKMKDALLVGYSNVIVVGKGFYEKSEVEIHHRTRGKILCSLEDIAKVLDV
jgi:prolyl-tRNA synthetase